MNIVDLQIELQFESFNYKTSADTIIFRMYLSVYIADQIKHQC